MTHPKPRKPASKAVPTTQTPARAPKPKPAATAKRQLPPEFLANAAAVKRRAQAALEARGLAAIARIREKLSDVAENLLDVAGNLAELAAPGVATALGYASFEDACQRALGVSPVTAHRWMLVAKKLEREFVVQVGIERARALLTLAEATPEDDTPEELLDATLVLPSGKELVVKDASTEQLDAAAKAFRQARADATGKKSRGFTTSPADRKAHAAIEKRLARAPVHAYAATRLVAQRDGAGPKVILEVRLAAWDETLAALTRK